MTTDTVDTHTRANPGSDLVQGLLEGFREDIGHVQPTLT